MTLEMKSRIFTDLKKTIIRMPSVLDFALAKDIANSGLSVLPNETILGRAMILDKNNMPDSYLAIIYLDNMWRIAFAEPGT